VSVDLSVLCKLKGVCDGSLIYAYVIFFFTLCACGIDGLMGHNYVCAGLFGLAWFVAWWFFSSESPGTHKTISNEEKQYIDNSLALNTSNVGNKVQRVYLF